MKGWCCPGFSLLALPPRAGGHPGGPAEDRREVLGRSVAQGAWLRLERNARGVYEARTETFLAPLARPLDLLQMGRKLYVLEYTRPIGNQSSRPMNPGRVLELTW